MSAYISLQFLNLMTIYLDFTSLDLNPIIAALSHVKMLQYHNLLIISFTWPCDRN